MIQHSTWYNTAHETTQHMIRHSTWYNTAHDTTQHMIQHSTWYNTAHDTTQRIIQHSTWYDTAHDTTQHMIQHSTWYNTAHDTTQHMIQHSTWYNTAHDTTQHMIRHSTWYDTAHDTTQHMIRHSTWYNTAHDTTQHMIQHSTWYDTAQHKSLPYIVCIPHCFQLQQVLTTISLKSLDLGIKTHRSERNIRSHPIGTTACVSHFLVFALHLYVSYVQSHHFPWLQPHELQSIRSSRLSAIRTHHPKSHVSLGEAHSRLPHTVFPPKGLLLSGQGGCSRRPYQG